MRLGIDFGTTRIVVACVDRGNYPIVSFDGPDGESRDWFPPVVAVRGEVRRYGFEAWAAQEEDGWTVVRSIKRLLARAGLHSRVEIGGQVIPLMTVLTEMAARLGADLRERSSATVRADEPLETMLGVPANAHGNQRFLTTEAFRTAGFRVLGLLNEPSAASIELGHRSRQEGGAEPRRAVLVYDFGGGTFDASLVELDDQVHSVRASAGLPALGGDDFDEVMAEQALEAAGVDVSACEAMPEAARFRLHEECRRQKEALHPNARRLTIDLEAVVPAGPTVTLPVAEYYERCAPLVDETLVVVDGLMDLAQGADGRPALDAIYVIGGASELPLVARRLRERFGRKVRRSPHPRSATAIGLAIQADVEAGYVLRERFSRHFGVWREADGGATAVFDPVFAGGTPLPGPGEPPLQTRRRYRPTHDIGHFRFLECSRVDPHGRPDGDLTQWDEIRFPFVPSLAARADLEGERVAHDPAAPEQEIEEVFTCDAAGRLSVTLANLSAGYARTYPLGHWGARGEPLRPARGGRRPTASRGRAARERI